MLAHTTAITTAHSAKEVKLFNLGEPLLSRYRDPSVVRSTFELIVTAAPFVALWLAIWAAWEFGYGWIALLLAVPAYTTCSGASACRAPTAGRS